MKKKKKRRIRWNNVFLLIIILTFLTILIINSVKLIKWLKDSNDTKKEIIDIQETIEVIEVEDSTETEIIENEPIEKDNPYWDYIKMNLINVDFDKLTKKNSDTVGWIQVSGTNINYPFVQTTDNSYYLTHSFDKSYNKAGWVFMDYRNDKVNFNKNTILYAHSRKNNTMFGSLHKALKSDWLNNTQNHVVKLSTKTENTLWQVFSVYTTPVTSDYIQVKFANNTEFLNFANMLLERSIHNFNNTISKDDKILTLSTCYNENDRTVLHAKLIKTEKK